MQDPFRVGVVGAGVFASYHAAKVAAHPRCLLVGVTDRSSANAHALANRLNSRDYADVAELASVSDALIIAVPASVHSEAAIIGARAKCHLLIEKPLATRAVDAAHIIDAMDGRVLQVGHQERVVADVIGLPDIDLAPKHIEIVRHTPRAKRGLDTSVVMDLMIHDLDLLHSLYGAPDWVSCEAARIVYSDHLDEARAELGWGDMTAYVSASRNAESGERRWTLRYDVGTIAIDFSDKTLRHDTPFKLDADFGERPDVRDSLGEAFDRFVCACLDGGEPLATGADGLAAVTLAERIVANATVDATT